MLSWIFLSKLYLLLGDKGWVLLFCSGRMTCKFHIGCVCFWLDWNANGNNAMGVISMQGRVCTVFCCFGLHIFIEVRIIWVHTVGTEPMDSSPFSILSSYWLSWISALTRGPLYWNWFCWVMLVLYTSLFLPQALITHTHILWMSNETGCW